MTPCGSFPLSLARKAVSMRCRGDGSGRSFLGTTMAGSARCPVRTRSLSLQTLRDFRTSAGRGKMVASVDRETLAAAFHTESSAASGMVSTTSTASAKPAISISSSSRNRSNHSDENDTQGKIRRRFHSVAGRGSKSKNGKNREGDSSGSGDDGSTGTGAEKAGKKKMYHTLNENTQYQLCFLRHGQSTWNRDNRFIGWTDTPLTDDGVLEARVAGKMLHQSGILFDEVHTSWLRRSIRTANLALMEMGQEYIPVHKHWRLNERSYGDLVGANKKEAVRQYGKDKVKSWRRAYDDPPPPMEEHHPYHPKLDPRYRLMLDQIPHCESLKDTVARSSVYWKDVLEPALKEGRTLLIVGHENNLRSLIMKLEGIPEEDIIHLNLPRAVPLAYRLDLDTMEPLDRADGKLDEATGFLRGQWLGGDDAVSQILDRDEKQVYDTTITENLETGETRDKYTMWMEFVIGQPPPEAKAKGVSTKSTTTSTSSSGGDPTVKDPAAVDTDSDQRDGDGGNTNISVSGNNLNGLKDSGFSNHGEVAGKREKVTL